MYKSFFNIIPYRNLGSESCTGRSIDVPPEETSACNEYPEALTGIIEVLKVESPPILICVEVLLDVSDT